MSIRPTPRSVVLERLAYTAAAPLLAAAPNLAPAGPLNVGLLLAGAVGVGGAVAAVAADEGTGRKLMRNSPLVTALAVDITAMTTTGWGIDAGLAAGWLACGWLIAPLSRHRRRLAPALAAPTPPPALTAAEPEELEAESVEEPASPHPDDHPDPFTRGVRSMWERAGLPGRTLVITTDRHEGYDIDCTLLVRALEEGRPISGLTKAQVAAAVGVDETDVHLAPVQRQSDGRQGGPGWMEVRITPEAAARRRKAPTTQEWWDDHIATGPVPGSSFVQKVRDENRKVTHYVAQVPEELGEARVDQHALAAVLKTKYDEGRLFVTTDGNQVLVSLWNTSPLAQTFPATRELLTPDKDGRWVTGYLGNGQPARNRVYTDRGAAHGLFVAPSGGGKTQLMALHIAADALFGAVVMLATEAPDEKTLALGEHTARYGVGALYMVRLLRTMAALMEIRGEMPWDDGQIHEWDPTRPGCPYSPFSGYLDEFLSAARNPLYGDEIMDLAETVSVKGRKYAVGIKVAGQSIYVQDGFTQLLCENLRENCIPVVLKVAPKKVNEMFKTLGIASENIPDPLPRSFSTSEAGRIERVMRGEPEPPADSNTGGAGWIVEGKHPEVLRTLFINFKQSLDPYFPDTITPLTDHEITELDARGLWFDWTQPPRPGEFGDIEDDDEDSDEDRPPTSRGRTSGSRAGLSSPREALDAIKRLSNA
ncbi:chromosome segregation protein ParM [Streptomyces albidoflavus]|uniref:chromosome segregation protein ParM n=1 Tax=Streptomyces albidoflavus TaxID=1886 RepID=UPI0022598A9F|nr:chromosome segregation protein ParM [Streptomyces albidoflavus]MCX4468444.1 chromosome segregation protein ParM [Streptomyces albidoflavus]